MDQSSWMLGQGALGTLSALGAFMGAAGQRRALSLQADIAEINAAAAERNAQATLLRGQREEQRSMLATANLKSTQQVRLAAAGVDLGEGSAARVLASTDIMGKIDANTIAADAVRSAWGYRTDATNFRNEALMRRSAAGAISPVLAAGTSMLTSASQVSERWLMLKKAGAFDDSLPGAAGTIAGGTGIRGLASYWGG